ncbi:MAG TPA: hypothetical protein VMT76_05300 [Puia sp.]|nr:hypothetical protein [Puia sp.]
MKIIVEPLAGLANKLRVIESAVSLSKDMNGSTQVNWITDWQMRAAYHELFEPSEYFTVTRSGKYKFCRSSFSLKGFKKPLANIINRVSGIDMAFNDVDIAAHVRPGEWDIRSLIQNRKNIYIHSCHDFYPYRFRFSWVKPLSHINEAITAFASKMIPDNTIGLHLRRTDNAASSSLSPDKLFEEVIELEIKKNERVVFFLATDNAATEKHFISKFGTERILAFPKKFGRESVAAIQDALADWVLLGKCKKLYCSYWSSFSETAAAVTNGEAIVLKL